ncbi:MAG: hypothetical protein ACLQIB_25395 [Isosphaeraceae bacterium]
MDQPDGNASISVYGVIWRALILVAFVMATFPPWCSGMGTGLDPSWVVALNEITHRHITFGKDIVFTYGPLGFVLVPLEHGSNLVHAVAFRLGLHVLWWISVGVLLFRVRGVAVPLLFAGALSYSGIYYDPIGWDVNMQLTGPMILTTIGYLALADVDRRTIWAVPAMVVAAGALLSKFNIGVACTGSIVVWAVIQLSRDRSRRMLGRLGLLALTYIGALGLFFRIYGGPISALGDFLRYSKEVASGYSSQMSYAGPVAEVAIFSVALGSLFIAAGAAVFLKRQYAPALLIILFPLFVMFKSAFVSHEAGHVLISCPTMVGLTAFLLPGRLSRWESWKTQGVVAVALFGCWAWYSPPSVSKVFRTSALSFERLWNLESTRAILRDTDARVKESLKLPPRILAQIGSASVDAYPWDICYVTANHLNWKPRFVIQSYVAYSPVLDRRSAEDYRGENAPQYILYSHRAISTQHPCIVDVQTRMEIYRWYDVVDQAGEILLLKRRVLPRWDRTDELGSQLITFRQRWEVPEDSHGPIILRANVRLNQAGKLSNMLYKVYPPTIRVQYQDGGVMDYRLVWQNLKSGFLVSSLPRDVNCARRFFEGGEADRVRSVTFINDKGYYVKGFHVSWYRASKSPVPPAGEVPLPVAENVSNQISRK